jgi:hypothetical protein
LVKVMDELIVIQFWHGNSNGSSYIK